MKAVIFDVGGVLAHDIWEHLLLDEPNGVASEYSLDKDQVKKVGKLLWEAFAYRQETQHNDWRALEREYWSLFIEFFSKQLPQNASIDTFIQKTDDFVKLVQGAQGESAIPILERLQLNGVDLAICSNNNEFWSRRQMDKLDLHRFFSPSRVVLSCRAGVSKSSRHFEMFHAAADAVRLPKSHCIFVDDRDGNVERSRQCGMFGILFKNIPQLDSSLKEKGL